MTAATDQASHKDRQRIVLRLAELGIPTTDAEAQRHVCAVWTSGRARRRSELTAQEAGSLYARLREMTAEQLAAVLARPLPAPPTDDVEPAEPVDLVEPEPEPEPEPCDVCGSFETEHTHGPDPEPVAEPAEPVDLVEDRPAPVVEDVEPPPVDVDAAALAAVERWRARVASGEPFTAPDRAGIPPRVPVKLGPAPDRMCPPACCYCGSCPTWKPAPPVDYSKTPGSIAYEEAQRWRR